MLNLLKLQGYKTGLFNLYLNEESGKLMMSITEEQLNTLSSILQMTNDSLLESNHSSAHTVIEAY